MQAKQRKARAEQLGITFPEKLEEVGVDSSVGYEEEREEDSKSYQTSKTPCVLESPKKGVGRCAISKPFRARLG